ncbi:hypothetical protein H6G65_15580 [Microcystis elabens FACHB-917]|nr:hypothetical protein [Microcystis elabens FACHB-917]
MLSRHRVAAGAGLAAGLIWILLALHSLSSGGVTWDEMFDFEGVNGAFWHGINWLKGAHPDLHTITFDLEWFGNATRWPTYLLWRLLMTLPWEQITSLSRTQIVLGSGYVGLNHLNAMAFALAGIGLSAALAWRLEGKRAGLLAGVLLLLLPTWMGHGWMNAKDIPMAASYLTYTLGSTLLLGRERSGVVLRVVGIALMGGSRVSSLAFIAVGEAVLFSLQGRRSPGRWLGSLGLGLLLGFLLTPQAWGNPLGYPLEAMRFIGDRQGQGNFWGLLRYFATNLFDLLPSPVLIGLLLLILMALAARRQPGTGPALPDGNLPVQEKRASPGLPLLLPTLLQLLIPPVMLMVGGKSLYNELRHLLMIQPPLCVLAGMGYARTLAALPNRRVLGPGLDPAIEVQPAATRRTVVSRLLLRSLLLLAAAATVVLSLELLLLSPYQYTYRSDLARLLEGRGAAPLRSDYWGFSGRETLGGCLKRQPCADRLARLPLQVDGHSFNPELISALADLLRPAPPPGPAGTLLITTDPRTLERSTPQAATRRVTLLPRPQRATLSAIALEPTPAA